MFDVAVVGLGAVGSAAAAALAERGLRVVGLDRFAPPHAMGSSHGETRMIRMAYYEGPEYMPLVRAAYRAWEEQEARGGRSLLRVTGGLMIGRDGSRVFAGSLRAARELDAPHEVLGPAEIRDRFPAFRLEPDMRAVLDPRTGILRLEDCLEGMLKRARDAGAELRDAEPVRAWRCDPEGIRIETSAAEYRARRAAFALGAWTGSLVPGLGAPLEVERTVQFWFDPVSGAEDDFAPPSCPPWIWEYGPETTWYGFPRTERGIKMGMHVEASRTAHADGIRREVDPPEVASMRDVLGRFMPEASGRLSAASVCMYTNTPDEAFVLDRHPDHPEIAVFTGGSGHAFKFAPVLGDILADLATDREPEYDLAPFRLGRFR